MNNLTRFDHWLRYGSQLNYGGFMTAILEAYCKADKANRERLDTAFPHLFTETNYINSPY